MTKTYVLPEARLNADDDTLAAIIIPTIGKSSVVPESYAQLRDSLPPNVRVVVVFNPVDPEDAKITRATLQAMGHADGCTLEFVDFDGPVGFGGALNAGLAHLSNTGGVPPVSVFFNDDIRAVPHWLESLVACFNEDALIAMSTEHPDENNYRTTFPVAEYGKIGLAGPVTTAAAGMQSVTTDSLVQQRGGHKAFSEWWRDGAQDVMVASSFLSGFCLAISRECAEAVLVDCPLTGWGVFDEAQYPIAGYEDNDLVVRAYQKGFRSAIDYGSYVGHVGHASFDDAFPDQRRGMRNRLNYYDGHSGTTQLPNQKLAGLYRVKVGSVHDFHLLRASLTRHAQILDSVSILLTNNPVRDMPNYPDWQSHTQLEEGDLLFLRALRATVDVNAAEGMVLPEWATPEDAWKFTDDTQALSELFRHWVIGVLVNAAGTRFAQPDDADLADFPAQVEVWTDEWNERDERNRAIEMAYSTRPDWLLSIDGDEIIEDRIRRQHFERWMTHPDPLVRQYDFGWLDHWNDAKHYRTDDPWGDGGSYHGGRHGRRLWRATDHTEKILVGTSNGLHCGNIPDTGVLAMRVCGGRFRHFGYVRQLDRVERYRRYQELDPNPDPTLVGGTTYRHIISAEGMRMELYNAKNGIALHMLCYEGTDPDDVGRQLDWLYPLVDHVVLVWTGAETPEKSMGPRLRRYAELFKCDILHCDLRQDGEVNFAGVRNAAIDYLSTLNEKHNLGLSWGMFVDPDESFPEIGAMTSIRRMAESTETYGWMFHYDNPIRTGTNTPSDSVRLFRLEPVMRLQGRVHESFDHAFRQIVASGGTPNVRGTRFRMFNPGLMDGEACNAKLAMYAKGLIRELEDNPNNGGAWFSLGLQFEAEGRIDEAVVCYQKSVAANPDSFIGYRALMMHHARISSALCTEMLEHLSEAHPWRRIGEAAQDFLRKLTEAPDNPATKRILDGIHPPDVLPTSLANSPLAEAVAAAQQTLDKVKEQVDEELPLAVTPDPGEDGARETP